MARFTLDRRRVEDAIIEANTEGTVDDVLQLKYSGRGMFGSTCLGLSLASTAEAFKVIAYLAISLNEDGENPDDMLDRVRTVSMGLGVIVYFPGVEVRG
jgi:hypothetical protein